MLLQFQADLLNVSVRRPVVSETTALAPPTCRARGRLLEWLEDVTRTGRSDREFRPAMDAATREKLYAGWKKRSRDRWTGRIRRSSTDVRRPFTEVLRSRRSTEGSTLHSLNASRRRSQNDRAIVEPP
jgi:hypothetical protein